MHHVCMRTNFNSSFHVITKNINRSSISVAVSSRRIPNPVRSTKNFPSRWGLVFCRFFAVTLLTYMSKEQQNGESAGNKFVK